jgi:hypothetical protein
MKVVASDVGFYMTVTEKPYSGETVRGKGKDHIPL